MAIEKRPWLCLGLLAVAFVMNAGSSCQPDGAPLLAPDHSDASPTAGSTLLARLVHITDPHIIDEESPARFAGAHNLVMSAWRPWESYSTQLLDGIIRTTNAIHASGQTIDFVITTGDACDNLQHNELAWFLALMDGGPIDPLSGIDDRPADARPAPSRDPHAAFEAQGIYRRSVHGDSPSIPWYALLGNHDVFSIGVFPIAIAWDGHPVGQLPLPLRPGIWLPVWLDPLGPVAHGRVTPAMPGPPALLEPPTPVPVVHERAFFDRPQFIDALRSTQTEPVGHGFGPIDGPPWYSVGPVPGLRLIGLYTSQIPRPIAEIPNHTGCILADQLDWLETQLTAADTAGELVIIASHHPSGDLELLHGSAVGPTEFRELLERHPCVTLHLAGHHHRNRVANRGGYLEIETCSTLDWPQEARLIEIWHEPTGETLIRYETFNHLDERWTRLGDDPLRQLRSDAFEMVRGKPGPQARTLSAPPSADPRQSIDPAGTARDRHGFVRLP